MKHLYFVRHGQSQANVDRVFAGHNNTPLTELGKKQAEAAGEHAKSLHINHIIASPIKRAHDTALIIAKKIGLPETNIEFNNLLMERSYGSAVGLTWDTNIDGFTDIETMDSVAERAHLALRHILALPYETILVVSHGTFWQKLYMETHPHEVVGDADEPDNAEISKLI
ncbi:MAG TPA: histidine phosphatase family protein [Candidatus Saccharimonadales bacterium]|nr:histidine phosphatase family protein [Candidatus Saccharimonadales bacterium]